jgi:signal transduction histidine kinase
MKTTRLVNGIALALALLSGVLGLGMYALVNVDSGVRLAVEGDRLVVSEILPFSSAARGSVVAWAWPEADAGAQPRLAPGMVVTTLNLQEILALPQYVYPSEMPTPDPVTGEAAVFPTGVEPATVTATVSHDELVRLAAEPVRSLLAITPQERAVWTPDSGAGVGWSVPWALETALATWVAGVVTFLLCAWFLLSGRAGAALRPLAWLVAAGLAIPMLAWPLGASEAPAAVAAYSVLVAFGLLPMAVGIGRGADPGPDRNLAWLATGLCGAGAVALWLNAASAELGSTGNQVFLFSILAAGMTLVPALAASGGWRPWLTSSDQRGRRLFAGSGLIVAGVTPFFAVQSAAGPYVLALPLWLSAVAIANRVTVRPLARAARSAQVQRDLVVAATEAERARVAADIHDDALQELTLLVRRLDAAGDTESAEIARGVSERLRAICGDLRLPILDDLGVGPALDWLVLRIERVVDGPVRLERDEGPRPPAEVELALFRVAQEALANAVKHGAAPITVRYRSTDGSASLSVDDSGAGIDDGAADRATGDGHYGLLNMAQRAEAIGAILDVRRWPGGGTHVQVEWRAP